jgi:hypothetical protein
MNMSIYYPIPEETLKEALGEKHNSSELQEASSTRFTDLVKLAIGIAGIFSTKEGRFPKETEENLV